MQLRVECGGTQRAAWSTREGTTCYQEVAKWAAARCFVNMEVSFDICDKPGSFLLGISWVIKH